jgi:hypothetical protein
MAVSMCFKCGKMISISKIPTGNPTAWQNPSVFALYYGSCKSCGMYCSDCIESAGGRCPNCGKPIEIKGPSAIPYEEYKKRRDELHGWWQKNVKQPGLKKKVEKKEGFISRILRHFNR